MSRYQLQESDQGLRLVDRYSHQHPLRINFNDAEFSYRLRKGGGRKEMLARAVGVKPGLRVVDCTAGLGRDSFLLASLGCKVTLFERSPIMAMLLEDGIKRAMANEQLFADASNLNLVMGDAIQNLESLTSGADVLLVDPMFPEKKKSAKVKGEMQFLQRFIGSDMDAAKLLDMALSCTFQRVVLKRPRFVDELSGLTPSFTLKGKSSRCDVFQR